MNAIYSSIHNVIVDLDGLRFGIVRNIFYWIEREKKTKEMRNSPKIAILFIIDGIDAWNSSTLMLENLMALLIFME